MTRHPYRPRLCHCGYEAVYGPYCFTCAGQRDAEHLAFIEWDTDCQ